MRPTRVAVTLGSVLLMACAAGAAGRPVKPKTLAAGSYGSPQLLLVVGAESATLEFNCAQGTLPVPIALDAKGAFSVEGTYTQGSGIQPPEPYPAQKTRYQGTLRGKSLRLRGTLPDGRALGPYVLTVGRDTQPAKCMSAPPRGGIE